MAYPARTVVWSGHSTWLFSCSLHPLLRQSLLHLHSTCMTDLPSFLKILFIFLFLAAFGLRCCMQAFSSCIKQGLLIAMHGLLSAVASLVSKHGLRAYWPQQLLHLDSVIVVHGLSCPKGCGILLDQELNQCLLHWQVNS